MDANALSAFVHNCEQAYQTTRASIDIFVIVYSGNGIRIVRAQADFNFELIFRICRILFVYALNILIFI